MIEVSRNPDSHGAVILHSTESGRFFPCSATEFAELIHAIKAGEYDQEFTVELIQDLKAIHGLDAETELSNILQTEILAEINRERPISDAVATVATANDR